MRGDLLYLLSAATFWAGLLALGLGTSKVFQRRGGLLELATGGMLWLITAPLLQNLGRPLPAPFFIPLVWPIAPFSFWFVMLSLLGILFQTAQYVLSLPVDTQKSRINAILGWAVFGAISLFWFRASSAEVKLLKGAIAVSLPQVLAAFALFCASLVIIKLASTQWKVKNLSQTALRYVGLILGSLLFSVPLIWTLTTSFKEAGDTTGSRLTLVPIVTEEVAFFDSESPLYSCPYEGKVVQGTLISKDGQIAQLELERPFPMRGIRISVPLSAIKEAPRYGAAVKTNYLGQPVTGFLRKDLGGGKKLVEVTAPPSLVGRRFETDKIEPIRKVGLRWQNYTEALEWLPTGSKGGLVYLQNSLILVVLSVLGTVLSSSFVAFGFARIRFPFRSALFGIMLATMMLPGAVTMLPRFLVWKNLGFANSLVPLWLPAFTGSAFSIFLLREFFRSIPMELEDASKIDGCSPLASYWKIMLPQVKPALVVVGIWTGLGAWNDFMGPLIYVSSAEKMPISYGLQLFSADKSGDFGLLMAFATMTCIPVVFVFIICQRFFVEGVQLSGLGGK